MEQQPKERIIFDENNYYGPDGQKIAIDDLMDRDGLNEAEVRESYTGFGIFEHAMGMRDRDYAEEIAALTAYFDGRPSSMSSEVSENAGNPVIVSGTIGRWDGTSSGLTVYDDLAAALDTSPSHFGGNNVFADCEIQKVWDENGHLFIHGAHHDGSVTVEVRQLSDDGTANYEAIADAWVYEPFDANGKTYDGSDRSVNEAMHDLWDATEPTRYMERAYGCPAEEWALAPLPVATLTFDDEISEVDGLLNFYIPVTFDVDAVFGTDVLTTANDDWLNVYANYDMTTGTVVDHLDLSLNRADGTIEYTTYPLEAAQRAILLEKMDAYCLKQTSKSLETYSRETTFGENPAKLPDRTQSVSLADESKAMQESARALAHDHHEPMAQTRPMR